VTGGAGSGSGSSGRRSRLGGVVPASLLASEEGKQAHEPLSDEGRWKHPLMGRVTFQNGLAVERAHGGGSSQSWGRRTTFGRLGGVEGIPGSVLGPHGDDEGVGELDLARGEAHRAYWVVGCRRVFLVAEARKVEVGTRALKSTR